MTEQIAVLGGQGKGARHSKSGIVLGVLVYR
jgi:hypothetical protein